VTSTPDRGARPGTGASTVGGGRGRFLLGIFVVSGFTGLIYESIWSHYLKLFLGHAAYAQSLVLAIFMGGMAVGSWIVAHYSLRIRRLLLAYALVEGLIGILGLLFHPIFIAASDLSFAAVIPALPSAGWIQAYKWSVGTALILPQSVLLGMTFPLISGSIIRRWPDRPGKTLATLYFTNSLGAAVGVLVSGFVLIDAVGLPGTIRVAGLLNVALAGVIWVQVRAQADPGPPPAATPVRFSKDSWARWLTLAACLTGMASFMYELGWIRMLSLVLGSSTHSFELMLSAFILGLALGGLYARRQIERIREPATYLAGVMLLMAALAALTLPAYGRMFDVMAWFLRTFARTGGTYVGFNLLSQLIAALIMIPASFCAGMTLPLLTRELMRRGAGERAIGFIYSANTFGAILGVGLTVHGVMPRLGIKGVILTGAAIHLALGFSLLLRQPQRHSGPKRAMRVAMGAALGVFAAVLLAVRLDPLRMISGVYRTGSATVPEGAVVKYLRDGKTATISLIEKDGLVTIATNGKPDAGLQMGPGEPSVDETTMVLAAAIPLSMQAHPRRVANIGFGSGLTTHILLASERIDHLDSIEIEPFMVQAARQGFGPRIANVFDDRRSHVVYEDAKTFFASSREPYDLIVSEPSNPWVSGVSTLFSDEVYSHITRYLTPDGYFAQWVQVYETNIGVLASIIKALAPHFGTYTLYNLDDLDILIVATRGTEMGIPDEGLLRSPLLRAELERIGVRSVADFQSRKIGDNRTLGPVLEALPVPANSDFFPYVDLHAPRSRYLKENAMELPALTLLPIPFLELVGESRPRPATAEPSPSSAVVRDSLVLRALGIRRALASGSLDGLNPDSARYLWLVGTGRAACGDPAAQVAWAEAVRKLSDQTAPYLNAGELEPLWTAISSSPCYREAGAGEDAWVDLFAAIAERNAPDIVRLGTGLLASVATHSDGEIAYLTTVTAAAYVNLGREAEGRALLQGQWPRFNHTGPFEFALRDLRALTKSGVTALPSASVPVAAAPPYTDRVH
jgi:predicted membrane-bound spermidine synthase